MKYKLRNTINPSYKTIEQILTNRGIEFTSLSEYINTTDSHINDFMTLGENNLRTGAAMLSKAILNEYKTLIVCDCDADGFTSASLLLNYLYDVFPAYVQNHIKWFVHSGKQHGLEDVMEYINQKDFKLIIMPDASSNDYDQHKELKERDIDVLVLDHHLADKISEDANIINNQLSDYPNKELSGVGVVWQFCRYMDSLLKDKPDYADEYLDLVALGNCADMVSLTSIETKHLINKGFLPKNVKNPYIYEMWQKNKFKLGEHISYIDAAFYIVPMVNAVQRSGTIEEKELLFKAMLKYEAFEMIPSTKRGAAKGSLERVVDQAVRMSNNVKNRQTRVQEASLQIMENKIINENLLDNKVIMFKFNDGEIDKNVAGLIANKISAKYQRPSCMLTKVTIEGVDMYQGSARGYQGSGLENFKEICDNTNCINWTAGHHNAFGISINADKMEEFIELTNIALKDLSSESVYYVDYIYNGGDVVPEDILSIADMKFFWGKDIEEPFIAIQDLKISKEMIVIYKKKAETTGNMSYTLKITLPNNISLVKFKLTEEEVETLETFTEAYLQMNFVGRCAINEWMGNRIPQVMIEEYEITGSGTYLF